GIRDKLVTGVQTCALPISARKTARLVEELKAAAWKRSPRTDADGQCEFRYQPEGWEKAYRFVALRYVKEKKSEPGQVEQYQLFRSEERRVGKECRYRM